ncbi:MAG TPA: alpha/beta hydrolase, partial [Clostridia bacterium]|nr:alpha/beta hydrolase [Clostridia bacterium]
VETWSLAGLSLGGWMALQYAAAYPRRVNCLIMLCPGGLAREKMGFRFKAMLNRLTGNRGKQKLLQSVLSEKTQDEGLKKGLMFTLMIGRHFNPRMAKLPIVDGETLARLTMPVLIVFGEKDPLLRPEASIRRLKRYAPKVRADVLPGVGHAVVGQAARILEFIGKVDSRE